MDSVWYDGDAVGFLDQRALPQAVSRQRATTVDEIVDAIRTLAVRGAPAIGIFGAYGVALAARLHAADRAALERDAARIRAARPTAVNLAWAVDRILAVPGGELAEAQRIHDEQRDVDRRIGEASVELFPDGGNVLTHCNTGPIATGGDGTALGCFVAAHRAGKALHVFVDETRPLLQGARLTMFELHEAGVPCTLIVDSAAAITMHRRSVRAVVVGADRIARNGDTANKIGTYGVAIAAAFHGIPFYIAAPRSTFDFALQSGEEIPIEERSADEVRIAAEDDVYNPAFDVTPGRLIAGFITEYGIVRPPYADTIADLEYRPRLFAVRRVKFYEFLDKNPKVDGLVVIEGEDPVLAQRALDAVLDRLLPEDMRALNCDVFDGPEADGIGRLAGDAVNAMPFLADRRVVVVRNCHRLRAQPRRDLWAVAENVPAGQHADPRGPVCADEADEARAVRAARRAARRCASTRRRTRTCGSVSCERRSNGSARRRSRA